MICHIRKIFAKHLWGFLTYNLTISSNLSSSTYERFLIPLDKFSLGELTQRRTLRGFDYLLLHCQSYFFSVIPYIFCVSRCLKQNWLLLKPDFAWQPLKTLHSFTLNSDINIFMELLNIIICTNSFWLMNWNEWNEGNRIIWMDTFYYMWPIKQKQSTKPWFKDHTCSWFKHRVCCCLERKMPFYKLWYLASMNV